MRKLERQLTDPPPPLAGEIPSQALNPPSVGKAPDSSPWQILPGW